MSSTTHSPTPLEAKFPDVSFGNNVQILGLANTRIGSGSVIADNCWLNVCDRDDQTRMVIGQNVLIGRQSFISSGGQLEIGDHCLFGPQVFVSDADHVVDNITRPYSEQGFTAGRVVVEENCWLGIHAVVTGSIVIGRGSVIAANAVINRDVPPFSIVVGIPARIIKMFNPESNTWEAAVTEQQQQAIMEARTRTPLPSREEYRYILSHTSKQSKLPPLLAGRGECI
ncbi:acyltransferase [Desulfovibrio ferrophilus]|uniref:Acetyltransferase n=1 Tax=Desulfovibrio ferrophilus TaxID=241368 RepID=A0A2Z6B1J2_9BACT|nr:acyltransferase [Desulfovibrio ferrophilus]BBD09310.1 acetyltransferase [Desulfovibrio ferrophilus]